MKEQAIDRFLNEIVNGIHTAADFASAQLPDLASQAVKYAVAENIFDTLVFAVIGYVAWRGHKWALERVKNAGAYDMQEMHYIWVVALAAIALGGGVCSAQTALKASIAPKVWLLEYAAKLAHGGCSK
jgi:hypothetical protein